MESIYSKWPNKRLGVCLILGVQAGAFNRFETFKKDRCLFLLLQRTRQNWYGLLSAKLQSFHLLTLVNTAAHFISAARKLLTYWAKRSRRSKSAGYFEVNIERDVMRNHFWSSKDVKNLNDFALYISPLILLVFWRNFYREWNVY